MITQTGNRSCRRWRNRSIRMAIGAMILSTVGCTEIEVGAEVYKNYRRTNEQPPAQPVVPGSARQDGIEPSLQPDPEAFHATGFALWDEAQTLPGIWIAHPMAEIARRVRLTNGETGAQVDAAMFRRDPNLSGPRIIVSSEAAVRLGLTPGHATPITIEGLAYRADTEAATVVSSAVEEPDPGPVEVLAADVSAEETAAAPVEPEATPIATVSLAPPADLETAAADAAASGETGSEPNPGAAGVTDAAGTGGTASAGEETRPVASAPLPRPAVRPGNPVPAPEASGDITDGRHFIQAGVFAQPGNAARLAETLRAAGLPANELPLTLGERAFTRVLVGPYRTIAERDTALETIRELGPADATPARG